MFFRHNDQKIVAKRGVLNALAAIAYIVLIALFFSNTARIFGNVGEPNVVIPMMFLSLFVLSATVMASLIFGKPVMLYVDGKKKEALQMLGWTVGAFACLTFLIIAFLAASQA